MAERVVEIDIELDGAMVPVGTMRCVPSRARETVVFEYSDDWLNRPERFAIDQGVPLSPGPFVPSGNGEMFPALGDSAPDNWGRALMRRRERRRAAREERPVRTLFETDYLMGVSDVSRIGALRLRWRGDADYAAPIQDGVPGYIALQRLLDAVGRFEAGEERDEDLDLIFAPGASLGGARPKCSVYDVQGKLSIAKFPKADDDYSKERWEEVAARLADRAGLTMADHSLANIGDQPVYLSARFDRRAAGERIPYMSAMTMTQNRDGVSGSYLEIVDAITRTGSQATRDREELYRRLVFTVLVSNTDDHMRNHGFLWDGPTGWRLSPAFDINPTSQLEKPRVLQTRIDFDDGTCDIDLVLAVAPEFSLRTQHAREIVAEVARATATWREVAHQVGAPARELDYLESAFEHDDLEKALTL